MSLWIFARDHQHLDNMFAVELTAENKNQLLVPRGFAHGFVVLSEEAIFAYKVDNYYSPKCDRGMAFDDPALGIDWEIAKPELQLSPKDTNQPLFKDAEIFDYGMNLYESPLSF